MEPSPRSSNARKKPLPPQEVRSYVLLKNVCLDIDRWWEPGVLCPNKCWQDHGGRVTYAEESFGNATQSSLHPPLRLRHTGKDGLTSGL